MMSLYYTIRDNWFMTLAVFSFLVILYLMVDLFNFVIIGLPFLVAYFFIPIDSHTTAGGLFMCFLILPTYFIDFYVVKTVPPTIICGEVVNIRIVSNGRSSKKVFDFKHQDEIYTFNKESYDRFRIDDEICVKYHSAFNNRKFGVEVLKEK